MVTLLRKPALPAKYWLRANAGSVFRTLHAMGGSGAFSRTQLDRIRTSRSVAKERELRYYLASLYLSLGEHDAACELLPKASAARAMKRYCAVLSLARHNNLPIPVLSTNQELAVGNIESRLQSHRVLIAKVQQAGGFAVVGNAPAGQCHQSFDGLCTFYFNHYLRNPAIAGTASVHVVTPAWQEISGISSETLLLTGHSIFHRRSRVWERFSHTGAIREIVTVPRALWASWCNTLSASPTAGLLVLDWLSGALNSGELHGQQLQGYVAGFSTDTPVNNHSFDSEKLSARHNWALEPRCISQVIDQLAVSVGEFKSPLLPGDAEN